MQEWKPVPERRRKENEGARHGGTEPQQNRHFSPGLTSPVILAAGDEPWLKKLQSRLRHFVLKAVDRTAKQPDRCTAKIGSECSSLSFTS
jgi:hypothetical protein